ncbi:MAG: lipoprotein signal peptidase [Muribaculaceae bacterium]|nr:lipoprotein signal peptidase [Muribaculaceae bacterium]
MTLTKNSRLALIAWAVIAAVIIIDQAVKLWVKTHFYLGEDIEILSWFHLRFIQNNGMAFGIELGSKLFLTLFRMVLVGFLVWYIVRLVRAARVPAGYMAAVALVTAGAFGNIVDCVFYGEIFNNPYPPQTASFVPWGEGYGGIFHGYVVDMLYFPLFSFRWPQWMPVVGGDMFSFFDPVFNIADAAITVGMAMIILFYSKWIGTVSEHEKVS